MGRKKQRTLRKANDRSKLSNEKKIELKERNTQQKRLKRSQFSDEQVSIIRTKDAHRKISERSQMTEEEHAEYKAKAKTRVTKGREHWSTVEKELYRKKMRDYQKFRRQHETPQQKLARLQKCRNYYLSRKKFDMVDFLNERYDFTSEPCFFCHRMLFMKQIDITKKEEIKAPLPDDIKETLLDKMITCHRCKNSLCTRGRLPSQVYWNSMDPGQIPEELKVLSFVETRMIARLISYKKIVKCEGRFGQYGLKGQAILFAQDVSEVQSMIVDVLPRKMNQIDLIMVVESRDNVHRQKELKVKCQNLKNALEWLVKNNQLYKDLQINLENLNVSFSQVVVEVPDKKKEEDQFINEWRP